MSGKSTAQAADYELGLEQTGDCDSILGCGLLRREITSNDMCGQFVVTDKRYAMSGAKTQDQECILGKLCEKETLWALEQLRYTNPVLD